MTEKIAEVVRSNLIESTHFGSIAVVSSDGRLMYSLGSADRLTYFHSSAKPIQGVASLEAGIMEEFGLDLRDLALIISSHSGEKDHIDVLKGILEKINVNEDIMECGLADPVGRDVLKELYSSGESVSRLHCNCSGKHLGLIAASKVKGYPLTGYHREDHPMQQRVKEVISDFCAVNPDSLHAGVDGCTIPVYAVPLQNMALAYANLCDPEFMEGKYKKSQDYIISAMTLYPEFIAGKDRSDTVFMKRLGGRVICKIGAEGVYCAGVIGKGTGIAIKIEDGSLRASSPVILEVLVQLGVLERGEAEEMKEFYRPHVFNNNGEIIGEIKPVFTLEKSNPWG